MNETAVFNENYVKESIDNKISFIPNRMDEGIKKYSYEDFREGLNIIGDISFKIIYFCYGFLQFFATWSALVKLFHHDNIIILITSFVLGFLPLVGTGFGIYGAYTAWGWNLSNAILVFFVVPYFIVNGPLLMIAFFEMYKDWKRWQSEKNI